MAGYMNPQFPDLSKMFGPRSVMPTMMGQDQWQQAMQMNRQNMDLGKQLYNQNEAMNPLLQKQQGLQNDQMAAQLPGIQADSRTKGVTADIAAATKEMQIKAKLQEMAEKMDESQLKQSEIAIQKAITDGTVKPENGEMLMNRLYEIRKLKMGLEERRLTSESVAKINQTGQTQREGMKIGAGAYDKQWKMGVVSKIEMEGDPVKKLSLLLDAAKVAEQRGDQRSFEDLMERAEFQQNLVKAKFNAQPKPGGVDVKALTEGQVPTNPPTEVLPQGGARSVNPGGIPSPKTQAEYDKLPSGTVYIDTDGKQKRKK